MKGPGETSLKILSAVLGTQGEEILIPEGSETQKSGTQTEPSLQEQSLFLPTKQSLEVNPITAKLLREDAQLLPWRGAGEGEHPVNCCRLDLGRRLRSPGALGVPESLSAGAGGKDTCALWANA